MKHFKRWYWRNYSGEPAGFNVSTRYWRKAVRLGITQRPYHNVYHRHKGN